MGCFQFSFDDIGEFERNTDPCNDALKSRGGCKLITYLRGVLPPMLNLRSINLLAFAKRRLFCDISCTFMTIWISVRLFWASEISFARSKSCLGRSRLPCIESGNYSVLMPCSISRLSSVSFRLLF